MTTREILSSLKREEGIEFFNAKKTEKEVYDILVSRGLTDSFETFSTEAPKLFAEKISKMSKDEILSQIEGAELTEEQLEQIAGGDKDDEDTETAAAIGGGLAAAAVTGAICTWITGSAIAAAGI